MKAIQTEIKLLNSLCENVEDKNLYRNTLEAGNQLEIIGNYCHQLGMSIADMIALGKNHCLDESEHMIKNLTMYFLLSFEDIVKKMCERTALTEDEIDVIIDEVQLDSIGYDTEYYLKVDSYRVCFGGQLFGEKRKTDLRDSFNIWKLIDDGTTIDATDNGEFGIIHGTRYDLANLSNEDENALFLSLLRMATAEVLSEQFGVKDVKEVA